MRESLDDSLKVGPYGLTTCTLSCNTWYRRR